MATATREPALKRQEIEQHKQAVEQRADRVVEDVKELTDVKSRLRKEGPRLAAIGGAVVVLVGGSLVLRAVLRRRGRAPEAAEQIEDDASLSALIAEIRRLREEMGKQRKSGGSGGLAAKIAIAAATAAASAAGKQAASRLVDRQEISVAA